MLLGAADGMLLEGEEARQRDDRPTRNAILLAPKFNAPNCLKSSQGHAAHRANHPRPDRAGDSTGQVR